MSSRRRMAAILAAASLIGLSMPTHAETVSLEELRRQLAPGETVSGRFVQCSINRSSSVRSSGRFKFSPGKTLELETLSPVRQSSTLHSDGRRTRAAAGREDRSADRSPVNAVIMSVLGLREEDIRRYFIVEISGSPDAFRLNLVPLQRLENVVEAVNVRGSGNGLELLRVDFPGDRALEIHLLLDPAAVVELVQCP